MTLQEKKERGRFREPGERQEAKTFEQVEMKLGSRGNMKMEPRVRGRGGAAEGEAWICPMRVAAAVFQNPPTKCCLLYTHPI